MDKVERNALLRRLYQELAIVNAYSTDMSIEIINKYSDKLINLKKFIHANNVHSNNNLLKEIEHELSIIKTKIDKINSDKFLKTFNNAIGAGHKKGRRNEHLLNRLIYNVSEEFKDAEKVQWAKMHAFIISDKLLYNFFKRCINNFDDIEFCKPRLIQKRRSWERLLRSSPD